MRSCSSAAHSSTTTGRCNRAPRAPVVVVKTLGSAADRSSSTVIPASARTTGMPSAFSAATATPWAAAKRARLVASSDVTNPSSASIDATATCVVVDICEKRDNSRARGNTSASLRDHRAPIFRPASPSFPSPDTMCRCDTGSGLGAPVAAADANTAAMERKGPDAVPPPNTCGAKISSTTMWSPRAAAKVAAARSCASEYTRPRGLCGCVKSSTEGRRSLSTT